jgi:hypothetical protein
MPRVEPAPPPSFEPADPPTPPASGRRTAPSIPEPPEWTARVLAFVAAVEAPKDAKDVETTRRIRDFYAQFDVAIPSRGDRVTIPFRINDDDTPECVRELAAKLRGDPATRFIEQVVVGRGTPDQITAIIQALDRRDPTLFRGSPDSVRAQLVRLGIGIDCAGSVQLALFASRGLDERSGPSTLHFRNRLLDNFSSLAHNAAFVRVSDPTELRPGDVLSLGAPPWDQYGHKVIVADRRTATLTVADAADLTPRRAIAAGHEVVLLDVASSWGGDGPGEHTWAFDPQSGAWASVGMGRRVSGDPMDHAGGGPWDHPLLGMYRPR